MTSTTIKNGTKPKLFRESGDFSGNRDTWKFFRDMGDNLGTLQKKIGTLKKFLFYVFISVNLGKLGIKSTTTRAAPLVAVYTTTHISGNLPQKFVRIIQISGKTSFET